MFKDFKDRDFKNICVIRSSSMLFPHVVDELKDVFPQARIFAIITEGVDVINQVDNIFALKGSGGFKWGKIKSVKNFFSDKNIDLAVVMYNTEKGIRYLNIDAFAFASGARTVVSVNIKKKTAEITKRDFQKKYVQRLINILWVCLNFCVSFIVVCAVVVVMAVTAPFIFCLKKLVKHFE